MQPLSHYEQVCTGLLISPNVHSHKPTTLWNSENPQLHKLPIIQMPDCKPRVPHAQIKTNTQQNPNNYDQ